MTVGLGEGVGVGAGLGVCGNGVGNGVTGTDGWGIVGAGVPDAAGVCVGAGDGVGVGEGDLVAVCGDALGPPLVAGAAVGVEAAPAGETAADPDGDGSEAPAGVTAAFAEGWVEPVDCTLASGRCTVGTDAHAVTRKGGDKRHRRQTKSHDAPTHAGLSQGVARGVRDAC